jgi:hypothetical protein
MSLATAAKFSYSFEEFQMFTVGQIVKHVSGHRAAYVELVVVTKISKSGVIQIKGYESDRSFASTFRPDGRERGNKFYGAYLRPLDDGEAPESLLAAKEKRIRDEQNERNAKNAAHAKAVREWWDSCGKAIWDNRVPMATFLGEQVVVLRYTRYGEQHMPFVVVKSETNWRGESEIVLNSGGLVGRITTDSKCISSCSNSTYRAPSIAEALYQLIV